MKPSGSRVGHTAHAFRPSGPVHAHEVATRMIVFTYPGQGSQKPGMGEPWREHPSWELVAEASEAAERDVESLLLSADADELKQTRNAQLATFVLSMVVL